MVIDHTPVQKIRKKSKIKSMEDNEGVSDWIFLISVKLMSFYDRFAIDCLPFI